MDYSEWLEGGDVPAKKQALPPEWPEKLLPVVAKVAAITYWHGMHCADYDAQVADALFIVKTYGLDANLDAPFDIDNQRNQRIIKDIKASKDFDSMIESGVWSRDVKDPSRFYQAYAFKAPTDSKLFPGFDHVKAEEQIRKWLDSFDN